MSNADETMQIGANLTKGLGAGANPEAGRQAAEESRDELKKLLEKATYVIVNSDIENNLNLLENIKATIVTYGFNTKATITASSVEEEEMLLCIQRTFQNKEGKPIEPQEIKVAMDETVNCTMAETILFMIYGKII